MPSKLPFFILGNPRSGTSLFRLMVNSHPNAIVPPECGFVDWLYNEYGDIKLTDDIYKSFIKDLFRTKKFESWGISADQLLSSFRGKKPSNYLELVRLVYLEYAKKIGKKHVDVFGDKNNYYMSHIDRLERIFPNCKKVFIVRDGRDVACSYLELKNKNIISRYKPDLSGNIEEIAKEWLQSTKIMEHWSQKGALTIRYEDLVCDPKSVLTKVCNFISIEYTNLMLDFYKNNDEPNEFKAWKSKTFEPVKSSSLGRFKEELGSEQIELFERIAAEGLLSCGYSLQ